MYPPPSKTPTVFSYFEILGVGISVFLSTMPLQGIKVFKVQITTKMKKKLQRRMFGVKLLSGQSQFKMKKTPSGTHSAIVMI